MILTNECLPGLKYIFFIIIYSNIFYINHIYKKLNTKQIVEIDNELKLDPYENQTIFYKKTNLKPIAFYYPEYNSISYYKYFNNSNHISTNDLELLIKAQINLAKNHKIFGFAIDFNIYDTDFVITETMNILLNKIKFPFFLIWRNDDINNNDISKIKYFFGNLKKYIDSENYIKIQDKPVISLKKPNIIKNRLYIISLIRTIARNIIGEIFLIYPFTGKITQEFFYNEFDGAYDYSIYDLFQEITNRPNIIHYSGYIYKNLIMNRLVINFTLFRTCYLNYKIFDDYKPEQFYITNKIIFKREKNNNIRNKGFIFINSWNDYQNGNYLEYNEKYGYASINTFSKSLLNIKFNPNEYKLDYINNTTVAIHIHVYYEQLLNKTIKRINKMPIKYDLYISTTSKEKKEFIENYIEKSEKTTANKYEIKIYENKGRDVYPFIRQMRNHYKKYKYICHLHTKRSAHKLYLGANWSEYLYKNLIGSKRLIYDILYYFEQNAKLGFIFPEPYYELIKGVLEFNNLNIALHIKNKKFMNFILNKIFHKYKVGDKLIFPIGDMFWAKTKAIYQIFNVRLKFPEELGQTNETIMHAIERLWLYLVKLNGYYYKTTFKYY